MHINTVCAPAGFHWLKLAFLMLRRQPLAWVLLFGPMMAASLLLQSIPWVGWVLSVASGTLLWLLIMVAAMQVFAGRRLRPAVLLAALQRERLPAVLMLSALYVVACLAPLMPMALVDGGSLAALILNTKPMERAAAAASLDMSLMLCWLAWMCALSPAFWFAPGLVHWHGVAPLQALWISMVACWRNWRAMLVLFLSWMGIMVVLVTGAMVVLFLPLVLCGVPQSAAMQLLIQGVAVAVPAAAALVLVMAYQMSAAFSLRDCFGAPGTPPRAPVEKSLNAA